MENNDPFKIFWNLMIIISLVISFISLGISLITCWFTIFYRGKVCSTKPSFIAFRYDFVGKKHPQAKIFLRALLFTTGKRGRYIESLFLWVRDGKRSEEFSFWGYGEKDLVRGSGVFVDERGVVTNHHFNPVNVDEFFGFTAGTYEIELMAKIIGIKGLVVLSKIVLDIPSGVFDSEISQKKAIYFNWSPSENRYVMSIEHRT